MLQDGGRHILTGSVTTSNLELGLGSLRQSQNIFLSGLSRSRELEPEVWLRLRPKMMHTKNLKILRFWSQNKMCTFFRLEPEPWRRRSRSRRFFKVPEPEPAPHSCCFSESLQNYGLFDIHKDLFWAKKICTLLRGFCHFFRDKISITMRPLEIWPTLQPDVTAPQQLYHNITPATLQQAAPRQLHYNRLHHYRLCCNLWWCSLLLCSLL